MSINYNLSPDTVLAPHLTQQLTQYGINLNANVSIERTISYNRPVSIFAHAHLARSKIDAYTYIKSYTRIVCSNLGRYCSIAHGVEMGIAHHNFNSFTTSPSIHTNQIFTNLTGQVDHIPTWLNKRNGEFTRQVIVGHDVWIGCHTLIPTPISIGHGAVIGAGSIVTKDIPPYTICSNGPKGYAIPKKARFSDEIISDLMELNWWQYDMPKMQQLGYNIPTSDIKDFIAFMHDQDLASLPTIKDQWLMLYPLNANNLQLIPLNSDFNYPHTENNIESNLNSAHNGNGTSTSTSNNNSYRHNDNANLTPPKLDANEEAINDIVKDLI